MVAPLKISSFSDAELVQKYRELWYRSVECAIVPDHPQTKKNGSRWARELRQGGACLRESRAVPGGCRVKIVICGPNLYKQDRGQFHVHADGCGDVDRDPQGSGYAQAAPHMEIEAATMEDVVGFVYADQIREAREDSDSSPYFDSPYADVDAYFHDFHFAPCCVKKLRAY